MSDISTFKSSWQKMSTPPSKDTITICPIPETNAYLAKYFDESFGLFLTDITDKIQKRAYKHIEINFKKQQQISIPGKMNRIADNCLILQSDTEIKTPLLSMILDFLHDEEPSGNFTASNLISVLDDVEELIRRPKSLPTLQEVAGVWGELYILKMLLHNSTNHQRQIDILRGWEGEIREKIDFRFLFCKQVLEIKTTVTDKRIHHLHGIEQVTIPPGFDSGALASLLIETGHGITNSSMIDSIRKCFKGSSEEIRKCLELLETRIMLRGDGCVDDRFPLELAQNGLAFFKFESVPAPTHVDGVLSVEWISDLTESSKISYLETDKLVHKITQ